MNEPNKLLNKNPSPTKTWIHSDDKMQDGIIYNVKVRNFQLTIM